MLPATALSYLRHGLCVLPARRDGQAKSVALTSWKPFQSRLPTADEVRGWFAVGTERVATCLVCGAVSGNLEVIDFDAAGEAFADWQALVREADPGLFEKLVIETTPSGGMHVIYRSHVQVGGNQKIASRYVPALDDKPVAYAGKTYQPRRGPDGGWHVMVTLIETRGEGGICLCAPSDGYELVQGELNHLPVVTATERETLLAAAGALNQVFPAPVEVPNVEPSATSSLRPGDDFAARGDVRAVLRKHGWSLVRHGENEYWRRPGRDSGSSATLKGGVFYVFTTSAPPFEGGTAYGPFAVYAMLEHQGDFAAAARELRARGYGDDAGVGTHGGVNGDFRGAIANMTTVPGESANALGKPISAGALMDGYTQLHEPILGGLLRRGEVGNLIASSKSYKTYTVLALALCAATGRSWLGSIDTTKPRKVLVLDNELHRPTIARRLKDIAAGYGIMVDEFSDQIHFMTLRGEWRDIHSLDPFFRSLKPGDYDLVILDALYRFWPADTDENDNGKVCQIYNRLDQWASWIDASIIIVHHASKGDQSGKSITDMGAGAGAQSRCPDVHMAIRRHEEDDCVVLDARVRSFPPFEPKVLRWQYPTWHPDPTLDPSKLHRPGRKERDKADPVIGPAEPESPAWTLERFVQAFVPGVTAEPRKKQSVVDDAVESGMKQRLAERLLRVAIDKRLAFVWHYTGTNAAFISAREQKVTETARPKV